MHRLLQALTALLFLAAAATAAAASYAQRDDVRAFIAEMHEKHGLDAAALRALFARTKRVDAVVKAVMPPKDTAVRSWQTYRSRFVEPRRIAGGLRFWQQHAATLAQAEARYGVPADIVLGILGVETLYGRHTGRFRSFDALATLAFDYPPRAALFRGELEALLLLARDERRDPLSYQGSYAGALGLPQFLPSSLRNWGTDFDGDGRVDLLGSPADAIGSVANFLKAHGWEADGPIASAAAVADEAAALVETGIVPQRLPAEMPGVLAGDAPARPAALIDLVTPAAPTEYWLGYRNFYVLTRYNRSSFYAMAVFQLAQTLKAERQAQTDNVAAAGEIAAAGTLP